MSEKEINQIYCRENERIFNDIFEFNIFQFQKKSDIYVGFYAL